MTATASAAGGVLGAADRAGRGPVSRTIAVPGSLAAGATAALGCLALAPYQGGAAPSPLVAFVTVALGGFVAITAAERRGGHVAAQVTAAMVELAVIGWIIQSRAPVSQSAGGGSTVASAVAMHDTSRWGAFALCVFLACLAFGDRLVRWRHLGGLVGGSLVVVLLVSPLVPGLAAPVNGVHSWISVGGVTGQPGELARVLLVLFLAAHLDSRGLTLALPGRSRIARASGLGAWQDVVRVFAVVAVALVLLVVQDDLGPAVLVVAVAGAMAWIVTGRLVYPAAAVAGFVGGAALVIQFGGSMSQKVSGRVDAWLDPFGAGPGATVNGVALEAQARGGLFGRGLGPAFDPYWVAARNDYIVPQTALRLGFVGVVLVAVLLAVVIRGLLELSRTASPRGRLVACGAACTLGFQALLIAAGSTSSFVLTGVPFPFLSYGGTSLAASTALVGLAIAATAERTSVPTRDRTRVPAAVALGAVMLVLAGAIGAKALGTATIDAASYAERRDNPWNHEPVSLDRGRILSSDGTVLARSVERAGEWRREYPLGPAAAGVVGWVSRSGSSGGAELAFDEELAAGEDVQLTLDAERQQAAYRSLAGRTGAVVVLDHQTGAIEVLASSPSFDPEPLASPDPAVASAARDELLDDPADPLVSTAYQQRYAPGSIFKLVTAVAAVEHGVAPDHEFPVLRSWTAPSGAEIANADGMACGGDLARMLEVSCNTTATEVGVQVGLDEERAAAEQLGLGSPQELGLPSAAGLGFPDAGSGSLGAALAGIGQGDVSLSPLDAAVMAASATQGPITAPHIRAGADAGSTIAGAEGAARDVVRRGMAACIDGGTCRELQGSGLDHAKTGTAEAGERRNAWVVATNDQVAVAVLLRSEPGVRLTGGGDAAPIAAEIQRCCGDSPDGGAN